MTFSKPPAAPPTHPAPPVPLAALLGRRELGLRLLAGPDDVALHWVHTSEMADPYPYLLGGELLLTAGVQLADPARYVERVVEAGAAALGFGVTPVYDTVPVELVEACVRHGLPLIEVPPRTPFTAVARALWRLMAEARLYELRRVTEAQQSLATAAARPAPVPAVLGALASRLGGRAVLYGADGTESAAAGRELPAEAARALADLAGVVGPRPGGPASASGEGGGLRLAAYALGGGDGLTLGVATERRDPGDHPVTGVAVVLLSLLTAPHGAADVSARDGALTRLLLGAPAAEAAAALSPGPWTVVHARGGDGTPFAAASLAAELGTELVDAGPTVRLLLAPGAAATARPGWTLGVSAPAEAAGLPAADAQAARALRRAEATRTPLVRHRANGLAGLVDPAEAAAHARVLLAPLSEPQAETLRTWLSLHGSWDRTAAALGVHRNTVRQRIARCALLLDRDLDDADVRMELWFALR
ncbi:PucR family transcriptional regulator [Streptomyces hydrogenans]|uniref:PucR family transcriptional regulator n=4 Tax=Streptomyces hydrogenans TaxID=1873719 RepID=A0ABQ3P783_9ACTN|nr:PucR family transcriptional regulator [Streptomyces hydrogenans]GHI20891.1 PucR family transcriptional regulator [Streptomyces hydrogenans]